jgi:hypothetical protein
MDMDIVRRIEIAEVIGRKEVELREIKKRLEQLRIINGENAEVKKQK